MVPVAKSLRSELLKRSNAMILFVAGKRLSPWVTLEHTGRRSGRVYRTPLVTFPFGDGFVFMLPYGPDVDWCRNVMASGRAVLMRKGESVVLEKPQIIVDAAVLAALPPPVRFMTPEQGIWMHRCRRPETSP